MAAQQREIEAQIEADASAGVHVSLHRDYTSSSDVEVISIDDEDEVISIVSSLTVSG